MATKSKFQPGDSVLWADPSKHSSKKVRAKIIDQVGISSFGAIYGLFIEGGESVPNAFESELEAVGGHVHYNMATVIPTSILTLEKAIKEQLKVAAEWCNDDSHNRMQKLCDDVDTMYAELHEALDLKPIMPGFPEFIMGSMARDLGHNLPPVTKSLASNRLTNYLNYWAQKNAPNFISFECHYCDTKLKTFRPAKGNTRDTMLTCPYCEEDFFIDVTYRKVVTTGDPSTYPNDVAQALMHQVRKGSDVFQLIYGGKEILWFDRMGRWTGPMPDSEVFQGLLRNLHKSAVHVGQQFTYEEHRYGDPC